MLSGSVSVAVHGSPVELPREFGLGSGSSAQDSRVQGFTHRPLSSSFLWFIFRILQGNPKKELLRGLWVGLTGRKALLLEAALATGDHRRAVGGGYCPDLREPEAFGERGSAS